MHNSSIYNASSHFQKQLTPHHDLGYTSVVQQFPRTGPVPTAKRNSRKPWRHASIPITKNQQAASNLWRLRCMCLFLLALHNERQDAQLETYIVQKNYALWSCGHVIGLTIPKLRTTSHCETLNVTVQRKSAGSQSSPQTKLMERS